MMHPYICIFNFLNYSHSNLFFPWGSPVFHSQRVRHFLLSLSHLRRILILNVILGEIEGLIVFVSLACSSIHHVRDTLALLLHSTAVDLNELIDGQEASSDTNDDGLALKLHKHSLPIVTVYSRSFSLEEHPATHV